MPTPPRFRATPLESNEFWFPLDPSAFIPVNLYLDAVNGDDANDGLTPATALKTLLGLADKSPVLPPYTIQAIIAPGNYADLFPFSVTGSTPNMVASSYTLLRSMTPTGADINARQLIFAGAGFTPGEFIGKLMHVPDYENPGDGLYAASKACVAIMDNDATTITVPGPATWINTAHVIEIIEPNVHIHPTGLYGDFNAQNMQMGLIEVDTTDSSSQGSLYTNYSYFYGCIIKGKAGSNVSANLQGCTMEGFQGIDFQNYTRWYYSCVTLPENNWSNFLIGTEVSDCHLKAEPGALNCSLRFEYEASARFINRVMLTNVYVNVGPKGLLDLLCWDGTNKGLITEGCADTAITVNLGSILNADVILEGSCGGPVALQANDNAQVRLGKNATITSAVPGNDFNVGTIGPFAWAAMPQIDPATGGRVWQ